MDGKSKQKIKILFLFLLVIMLLAGIGLGRHLQEKAVLAQQKKEIAALYPEKETALRDAIDYYNRKIQNNDKWIFLCAVAAVIGFGAALCYLSGSEIRREKKRIEAELDYIYEQLRAIQNQKEIAASAPESQHLRFADICEKLSEVSHAISVMQTRLREEENSTKALITDISHQLKTPLASIRMSHELAEESDLSKEERASFRASEEKEIYNMEVLLDELVKLSRLENSMITIRSEEGSLNDTICEAVSLVYGKAAAKNTEILVESEDDIRLPHDRQWTTEALANIMENAIKYSHPDSVISVRVIRLATTVLIEVEDDGIGILEQEVNHIFQRFYRGSNAKEAEKEGAGVGLYLARMILEQQGGTIVAKRKNSHGTIFKVTLPL